MYIVLTKTSNVVLAVSVGRKTRQPMYLWTSWRYYKYRIIVTIIIIITIIKSIHCLFVHTYMNKVL